MLAAAGIRWVRMDFKWDLTELEKGKYDFAPYDRLMSSLQPFGLRALFILDYGNPLYDGGAPPRTEATRQAFARWAAAAAKHFAGRGVIWEIFNEPNNPTFWPPRPDANEYAALALAVGREFRATVPEEKLIGPAIGEMDFAFLEECFKAGLLEYWSAVSVHPYLRSDPEMVGHEYCRLREMIKAYAPPRTGEAEGLIKTPSVREGPIEKKDIPIFSSEWGYSAVWPGMTDETQGQMLARQWLTNVGNNISLSIWYDWQDDGVDPKDPEHHFGMISNDYHEGRDPVFDPKPSYLAAKTLTTFFAGYQFEKRLNVDRPHDYVLVFQNGKDLRVAAWTTATSHKLSIPLRPGRYRGTNHTGADAGTFTADYKGLVITLTTAPIYLRMQVD